MKLKLVGLLVLLSAGSIAWAANFWQQLGGPSDNAVFAQAVNPLTGDLFVAFPTHLQPDGIFQAMSVFRSTNQAATWESLTNGLDGLRVAGLVTKNSSTVFAAAHVGGILRSTDNGASWQQITNGLANQTVLTVALDAAGNVFGGSSTGGVFRTSNDGTNWLQFNSGLTNLHVYVFQPGTGGALFAGTDGGVFRTLNQGTNWISASAGLTNQTVTALAFTPGGDLIAGTSAGIFRSLNNGTNWSSLTGALPNTDVRSLLVDGAGTIFTGTASGLFAQTNGAANWTAVNLGVTDTNFSVGKLNQDSGGRLFAGTAWGVFRSVDGGASWTPMKNGLVIGVVKTILPVATGEIFAGTLNAGLFRSRDAGQTWERQTLSNTPATTHIFSLAIMPSRRILAGTYLLSPTGLDTHVFRSDNGGDLWQGANPNALTAQVVGGFASGDAGEIFATRAFNTNGQAGVMRSDDGGVSWTATGLQTVVAYSVRGNAAGNLFAGTESLGVYRSLNHGTNWIGVGPNAGNILALALNATGHIFAASSSGNTRGLYRSLDNGTNWVNVLPNTRCGSVVITLDGVIYAGATEGIFCSTNNGTNWTTPNSGLFNASILSLAIAADGHLYAGSGGAGVFRSALPVNPVSTLSFSASNGIPALQLHGRPDTAYSLLTSTNLADWQSAAPITTAADGDSAAIGIGIGGKKFYRAVWP